MTGGVVPASGFIHEGSASPVATDTAADRFGGFRPTGSKDGSGGRI